MFKCYNKYMIKIPQLYFLKMLTLLDNPEFISHHSGSFFSLSRLSSLRIIPVDSYSKLEEQGSSGAMTNLGNLTHGCGRNTSQITPGHKGIRATSHELLLCPVLKEKESRHFQHPCLRVHDEFKSCDCLLPSALIFIKNLS